jgi:DNA-directed RNA polymerase subunit RPC12/RpoP
MSSIKCDICQYEFQLKKRYTIFIFDSIESQTYMIKCPKCKAVILAKIQDKQK